MKFCRLISIFLAVSISLTACRTTSSNVENTVVVTSPVSVQLVAVGDMLMHAGVSSPALTKDGSYNYDYLFVNMENVISDADIAVVNNEVIMGGNEYGNIGYPAFNVRTELADAEVKAGFNVILNATNHTLDKGINGIFHCISYWKKNYPEVTLLGIHSSYEDSANITVKDYNGIKIAMLNYTYGTNGLSTPANFQYVVDTMTSADREVIAKDIANARNIADFIIVFPHWGTEYSLEVTELQREWASFFAEQGVDLVIGSHPHVVEPVEWVKASDGHRMLVYYSLGNFVSIQYYNYSMLGGMADVVITKNDVDTYISSYDIHYLVTHYNSDRSHVTTYFLDDYSSELAASHAILTEPPTSYDAVNSRYPFTIESLQMLAHSVCKIFN